MAAKKVLEIPMMRINCKRTAKKASEKQQTKRERKLDESGQRKSTEA